MQNSWRHPERLSPEQVHCWCNANYRKNPGRRWRPQNQEGNRYYPGRKSNRCESVNTRSQESLSSCFPSSAMGCPEKVNRQRQNAELPNGSPRAHRVQQEGKGRSQLGVDTRKRFEGRLPDLPCAFQHLPTMRHESRPRSRKQPGPEHTQRSKSEMGMESLSRPATQRQNWTVQSECETRTLHLSLFADDTTSIGNKDELKQGVNEIKRVMNLFEEINDDKEEEVIFGNADSHGTRMLGSWLGNQEDLLNRRKRAGKSWED